MSGTTTSIVYPPPTTPWPIYSRLELGSLARSMGVTPILRAWQICSVTLRSVMGAHYFVLRPVVAGVEQSEREGWKTISSKHMQISIWVSSFSTATQNPH
jgi:hypothetical protein